MTNLEVLQIETTNLCNARCSFCVHKDIKEFGIMSDKLFLKILKNAKKIKTLRLLIPMLNGEPFTDPKFIERLRLINKILPKMPILIFTNGSLITNQIIKDLKTINNLRIVFSLNGTCSKTRKKLMGINDYDYVANMIRLYQLTGKPNSVLFVVTPEISEQEVINFKHIWGKEAFVLPYKNFAGKIYKAEHPQLNCHRAISQMTVNYKGQVTLCCMDGLSEVIFGNLNHIYHKNGKYCSQTIEEIWNSPHRQFYANAHLKGEIVRGLCENCTGG